MNNKNLIIIIEFIVLVILIGFLIYGYNQYSTLNVSYDNLKTEFESFTDFGTAKIKLPIDSDYEAILVAQNSAEYKNFYTQQVLNNKRESTDLAFFISTSEVNGKLIYTLVVEVNNFLEEFILNIDAETGSIISSES